MRIKANFNKTEKIVLTIMVLWGAILFFYIFYSEVNKSEDEMKKHSRIYKGDKIEAVITAKKIETGFLNKGALYIELNNNTKFRFNEVHYISKKHVYLNDFIQVGDSVYKRTNGDTIYIFRSNVRHALLLDSALK